MRGGKIYYSISLPIPTVPTFCALMCCMHFSLHIQCYRKKGEGAAVAMDNDIQPWLQRFVDMVGPEKAKRLLSGAGDFVELG